VSSKYSDYLNITPVNITKNIISTTYLTKNSDLRQANSSDNNHTKNTSSLNKINSYNNDNSKHLSDQNSFIFPKKEIFEVKPKHDSISKT